MERRYKAGYNVMIRPEHVMTNGNAGPVISNLVPEAVVCKFGSRTFSHSIGSHIWILMVDSTLSVLLIFIIPNNLFSLLTVPGRTNRLKVWPVRFDRGFCEKAWDRLFCWTWDRSSSPCGKMPRFPYTLIVASDSHGNMYGGVGTPIVRTNVAAFGLLDKPGGKY